MPRKSVFHVAPDGNDAWSGRLPAPNADRTDGPFATLERARDAIRGRKGTRTAFLRGGCYRRTTPFVLGPEDSGQADAPIVYDAWPGETPVISGGRPVTGWTTASDRLWQVDIPEVRAGQWFFTELWINGERRPRARWPLTGEFKVAGPADAQLSTWAATFTGDTSELPRRSFGFHPGDLRAEYAQRDDLEVVVLQYWMAARLRIAAVDEEHRTVHFTGGSWRPLTWSFGYYLDHVREGLVAPGAWFLDRRAGRLYYHPQPGEDLATLTAEAPVAEQLLCLDGDSGADRLVSHVTFAGITFAHTAWVLPATGYYTTQAEINAPATVTATGARHCAFLNCTFAHLGAWALALGRGCQENRLVGDTVRDVGAGCFKVGEPTDCGRDADEACRTVITDNRLADGGQIALGPAAIWIGQSGHNEVSHNEVSGGFQWAISVGWNWGYFPLNRARDNHIEYNHVHHLGTGVLGTHGAIYALGVSPGTVIRNNYIHHVYCNDHWGAGEGIILDNGCSGILVENNVVHDAVAGGFGCNFNCFGNHIINNILVNGRKFQLTRYGDPPGATPPPNGEVFARNLVVWREGPLFNEADWWAFQTLWNYNLYYQSTGAPVRFMKYTFAEWQAKGLDTESLVADPLFVAPERDDYSLRPDSPAFRLGFRPISLADVGPRPVTD